MEEDTDTVGEEAEAEAVNEVAASTSLFAIPQTQARCDTPIVGKEQNETAAILQRRITLYFGYAGLLFIHVLVQEAVLLF